MRSVKIGERWEIDIFTATGNVDIWDNETETYKRIGNWRKTIDEVKE